MSNVNTDGDCEDLDLAYVKGKRKDIITELMKDGVPKDNGTVKIILSALDGISRDALGKKKIKADEAGANGIQNAAAIIAQFLNQTTSSAVTTPVANHKPPILGDELPRPKLVDGETSTMVANETYYEFANRTGLVKDPSKAESVKENSSTEDTDI